jgi:hydrogenase/urease accessory protein HupE
MRIFSIFAAFLLMTSAALAHGGDSSAAGHAHDLLHAFGGPDHVIALISLGLVFVLIAAAPFLGRRLARSFDGIRSRLARGRSNR